MKNALRFLAASALAVPAIVFSPAATLRAQDCFCQPAYRVVNKVIYDEVPVTQYRVEYETQIEEREVTSTKPVYETEQRVRKYRVAHPILETATREERYFTLKPVYETEYREEAYDKVTWVQETEMRQQKYLVNRPVTETQVQERQRVVRRAVNETVMQQQYVTAMEPVTTYRTQLVDQGGFVDSTALVGGTTRNRLAWVPRGVATDNLSGQVFSHRAGFHWVPQSTPGQLVTQRVYVPNVVAQQIPQTSLMPRQMLQEVPVNVTRYQDEVVTEQIPVTIQRMEQTEEVREYPVTVSKPMTERIVNKIPVQKVRYEREEHVRQIPVQTQRIEYEDVEEPYEVKVCRMETEIKTIEVPVTVRKVVPYTAYRRTPRVVSMRIPYDAPDKIIEDAPVVRERIVLPADGGVIRRPAKKVEAAKPAEELRSDSATADGLKSVKKKETKVEEPTPAEEKEPKDSDPTGTPKIDAKKPAEPGLKAPEGTKPAPAGDKEKGGDKAA
ncbi:MAG: hypothetical protein ACKVP0_25540 [Pirellulaceae bacterium]